MDKHVVTNQQDLERLCRSGAACEWIALDTEFMRVRTYYARLCLLQIADAGEIACIDPLAAELDLAPLTALLSNRNVVKVLHAARQDLEVLYQAFGAVPEPLFDTQIAASLMGYGDQIGYASVVESVTGNRLAKAHTRTDWCERPLSPEQVEYALDDVRYLGELYLELRRRLSDKGRMDWAREEFAALNNPNIYVQDPKQAYKRLGQGHRLPPMQQHVLKQLANWRETVAQKRNLPRNWVAKDKLLVNIALAAPVDPTGLSGLDEMTPQFQRRHGREILNLVAQVRQQMPADIVWQARDKLTAAQRRCADRLMAALVAAAEQHEIATPLLGTRRDMERLVCGDANAPQLNGWRRQLVGDALLQVLGESGGSIGRRPDRSLSNAV